jgi:hypothetical protein
MEVIDMNKKVILGLMASLVLAGVVGCSNAQSSDKKENDKQSEHTDNSKMKMSNEEMGKMKNNDKK